MLRWHVVSMPIPAGSLRSREHRSAHNELHCRSVQTRASLQLSTQHMLRRLAALCLHRQLGSSSCSVVWAPLRPARAQARWAPALIHSMATLQKVWQRPQRPAFASWPSTECMPHGAWMPGCRVRSYHPWPLGAATATLRFRPIHLALALGSPLLALACRLWCAPFLGSPT